MKNKKRFRILFLTLLTLMLSTCFIYGISENDTDNNNLPLKIRFVSGPTDRIKGREDNIKSVAPGTAFILDVVDKRGNVIDAKNLEYEFEYGFTDVKDCVKLIHQKADNSQNIPAHYSFKFTIPYHDHMGIAKFRFWMRNNSSIEGEDSFKVSSLEFKELIPESMQIFIVKGGDQLSKKVNQNYSQDLNNMKGHYTLHPIRDNDIIGFKYNGVLLKPGQKLELDLYKQYVVEPVYADPAKNIQASKPATGWKKAKNSRWWYESSEIPFEYFHNVTKTFGKNTYRFDQSGWMTTGWYYEGGTWYYHNKKGEGVEGARAKTSWKKIESDWYYFDGSGRMETGWNKVNGSWYYHNKKGEGTRGAMVSSQWKKMGSKWYYFDRSGRMETGWNKVGNSWYYHNKRGEGTEGVMLSNKWKKVGPNWYYFDGSGRMATGWNKVGNSWYYFDNNGYMATGWNKVGNTWYYHNKRGEGTEGVMVSNQWKKTGSGWYYFDRSGRMETGWNKVGGSWYYHNKRGEGTEGVMVSGGWKKIGSKYYYFYGSGRMAANTYVGGYYVNNSGVWVR